MNPNYEMQIIDTIRSAQVVLGHPLSPVETLLTYTPESLGKILFEVKEQLGEDHIPSYGTTVNELRDELDMAPLNAELLTQTERELLVQTYREILAPEPVTPITYAYAAAYVLLSVSLGAMIWALVTGRVTLTVEPDYLPALMLLALLMLNTIGQALDIAIRVAKTRK